MKRNLYFAFGGLIVGISLTQVPVLSGSSSNGQAAGTPHKCDYTFITDAAAPDIGRDGKIQCNDKWRTVLEDGWVLKIAAPLNVEGYIFEKCR